MSSERGEDISSHGNPEYETITALTDIETGRKYIHKSFDELGTNNIKFLPLESLDRKINFSLKQIDEEIEKLTSAIDEKKRYQGKYMFFI